MDMYRINALTTYFSRLHSDSAQKLFQSFKFISHKPEKSDVMKNYNLKNIIICI